MINYNQKIDEIIELFPKGKELYKTSPLFNKVIQMLARGETPYTLLVHLIQSHEDMSNAMASYIQRDTRPLIFNNHDNISVPRNKEST